MTTTNFTAGTVIASSWLNDVDIATYENAVNVKMSPYNAKGDGSTNDTAAIKAAIDAALLDSTQGSLVYIPPGKYMVDEILVDLDQVVPAGAGKIMIMGAGQATQMTVRSTPNQNVFNIKKASGSSFSMMIKDLRFAVSVQGNNVLSAGIAIESTSTMLDFQISNCYFNGLPRGISGNLVSGVISNCVFDFMTDYGIYNDNKEFRKIEIVGCHFYRQKDKCIYIQGNTSDANRANTRAGGHLTITGCGFDRHFDNTVTLEHIRLEYLDNFVISGCWFNGKTPDSTDSPMDFIYLDHCCNFTISGITAYYYDRGLYMDTCQYFNAQGIQIWSGNKAANGSSGSAHLTGCTDFTLDVNTHGSLGTGVYIVSSNDFTVIGRHRGSYYSGVIVSDCQRAKVRCEVVDANQANTGTTPYNYGLVATGSTLCTAIYFEDCHSYVTDVSQGQTINLYLGAVTDSCRVNGGSLTSVRTAGSAFTNAGTNNRIRGVRGWETKNAGQATITNPATTIVVNHGLAATPSITDITLTYNDAAGGVTRLWPSTITSTQFTINSNVTPTTTALIGWYVDMER